MNHSLKFIKKSYILAFLFGLAAPLSYFSGLSLGGLTFSYSPIQTAIIIGIFWGLFLAIVSKAANIIEKGTKETLEDRDGNNHFRLLYDGKCPICNREICMLKKNNHQNKIEFIDITSEEFLLLKNENIDYKTAMSQIHLIDGKGKILVALDAFAVVYANCKMPIISTLLRIHFIKMLLNPLYKLFARSRYWLRKKSNLKNQK